MKLSNDLETIVLDHGTGGLLSRDLVENVISPILKDVYLGEMEDSAILNIHSSVIAMTTDSFVVNPIIFKNGDIGKISVCGTVNDLAVAGSVPKYLTLSFVLEVGFPLQDLRKILTSIRDTAIEAGIKIVAGDTKVVNKGEVDKIFINTTGVGTFEKKQKAITQKNIKTGDDIIITGNIGNHSIQILSMREGLGYESRILSDCAPLNKMIAEILNNFADSIHCMRDLTRGGLGSALNEISEAINMGFDIQFDEIPIQHEVKMASDMLGVNPIYLANEGNICIFVDHKDSRKVLEILRKNNYGQNAKIIGKVSDERENEVIATKKDGESFIIEHLYGMELPRLC